MASFNLLILDILVAHAASIDYQCHIPCFTNVTFHGLVMSTKSMVRKRDLSKRVDLNQNDQY